MNSTLGNVINIRVGYNARHLSLSLSLSLSLILSLSLSLSVDPLCPPGEVWMRCAELLADPCTLSDISDPFLPFFNFEKGLTPPPACTLARSDSKGRESHCVKRRWAVLKHIPSTRGRLPDSVNRATC